MSEGKPAETTTPKRRLGCLGCFFRLCVLLTVLLVLLLIVGGIVTYLLYDYTMSPGTPGAEVSVEIPEGATGREAGIILANKGLIEHEYFFRAAIKLDVEHGTIKQGVYMLPTGLSPLEYLHALYDGPSQYTPAEQVRVTIPEGLSLQQMAHLFEDQDAFWAAVTDDELLARTGAPVDTLEGFLMPNTYFFDSPPEPAEVVLRMFEQFEEDYAILTHQIPDAKDKDIVQILTVASLVEEEARLDEERPMVAAVIYNRLKRHMRLEMDCTLQYALNKYGQRMLSADKDVDSPYNTYKNTGLPPGPICNPGVASIRAALQPADAKYLYFVSNADGKSHTFSNTFTEHQRAVARFRRDIREQRRAQRAETAP